MESKKISPLAIKIEDTILLFRGQKVMLDSVLADLYQVPTRVLVQAMKRNLNRFPTDFVFQLSTVERESLRSQFVISNGRGGRRYPPPKTFTIVISPQIDRCQKNHPLERPSRSTITTSK